MSVEYLDAFTDFPACNHIKGVGPENLGYATGMTWDGMPYEAEIYQYGSGEKFIRNLSIIFPDICVEEDDIEDMDDEKVDSNITGFSHKVKRESFDVLPLGMVDRGQETNTDIIKWYVDYVQSLGMVTFTGDVFNGSVFYYTDINGNDLVQIKIDLIVEGREEATTELDFRDFPFRKNGINKDLGFKVVK